MEQLQLKDFLGYRFLNNVRISPDKTSCVFGVSVCDEVDNSYKNNLYVWKEGRYFPLTQSNKDSDAVYLDSETVLFKSSRSSEVQTRMKAGEEISSFYKISVNGGEAIFCFEVPLAVTQVEALNSNEIVFLASYDLEYSVCRQEEQKDELLKAKIEERDYEVFTGIPFCYNGKGFLKNTISRLYRYDLSKQMLQPISPIDMNVASFQLNQDKSEMVIIAEKKKKRVTKRSGIYTYHFETEHWNERVPEDEYQIDSAYYFNNGILFIGNKEWKHGYNENGRFYFLNAENQISLFYDNTESLRNSVGSDCRYGSGIQTKVCADKFYFIRTREKDSVLLSIDLKGIVRDEILFDGSIDCFDVDDNTFFYIAMKDGKLQELYKKEDSDQQLTSLNEEILKERYVADYNEVIFENDGISFTGWVLLPKDYDPDKKYPAILDIHGGPKTVYGTVFYHEMQLWANMGYFVFFTNPRGSDGRDNEFMNIFGKYGTIDYDDLMKFTDVVLEKYPAIDGNRVGVTGGSYGGFMTNWIIGHTNRFACAATQRSISNWISFYGTSDIGMYFTEDQIHGNIFDNPEKLWEHSPLRYAKYVETPTLFIHSDEDYRCPLEQGLQLYTAMVDRGIEARFVLFHGENHELSRGGKPKHRVRRLQEITEWMELHLKCEK